MDELMILNLTAASIGFIHTLLGPDHYLPFVVMAKARAWNLLKIAVITFLCGLGHILSSVVLGLLGIFFGIELMKLTALESFRGNIAAWLLIGFGLAYFAWGLNRLIRNKSHKHINYGDSKKSITPWILFTIFVFGPCEPLIPILMYPAAKKSILGMLSVTAIFGSVTILTMLAIVMLSIAGLNLLPMNRLEKYNHVLAGAAILICGIAICLLGL